MLKVSKPARLFNQRSLAQIDAMKLSMYLICSVFLCLLQEVEALKRFASSVYIVLAVLFFLILLGGIILLVKYSKVCNSQRQRDFRTTRVCDTQQPYGAGLQNQDCNPEFLQFTCPPKFESLHFAIPQPIIVPRRDTLVGEPPPPYPGM